jgi:hypothetical protein
MIVFVMLNREIILSQICDDARFFCKPRIDGWVGA